MQIVFLIVNAEQQWQGFRVNPTEPNDGMCVVKIPIHKEFQHLSGDDILLTLLATNLSSFEKLFITFQCHHASDLVKTNAMIPMHMEQIALKEIQQHSLVAQQKQLCPHSFVATTILWFGWLILSAFCKSWTCTGSF